MQTGTRGNFACSLLGVLNECPWGIYAGKIKGGDLYGQVGISIKDQTESP